MWLINEFPYLIHGKIKYFLIFEKQQLFWQKKKSGSLWFENTSGRKKKVMQFFSENSIEEK